MSDGESVGKTGRHPRINVRLPKGLLDELEADVKAGRFDSVSEAVRYAIRLKYDPDVVHAEHIEELVDWREARRRTLGRDRRDP